MIRRNYILFLFFVVLITSCEQFENQRVIVVNSDEVSTVTVRCFKVLGVPSMCAYVDETTRTVRIEDVVTRIIERIVSQKVITEVPIEKIVTQIEKRYINESDEIDIDEIVKFIIERIKRYVLDTDIINVPIEDIVDETTDYISNAPRPEDNTEVPFVTTPIGDMKSEDDTTPEDNTSTENDGNSNNGTTPNDDTSQLEDTTQNGDTQNPDDTTPDEDPDSNNRPLNPVQENNDGVVPVVFGEGVRLNVQVGPKKMSFQPSVSQPGVLVDIICNIDGNIVHPEKESFVVVKGEKWNLWGVSVWCNVPSDLEESNIKISVKVEDFKKWCGLTAGDVVVSWYFSTSENTHSGGDPIAAKVVLDPEVIPTCNEIPVFTEGRSTTRNVSEHTPANVPIGFPISATDGDEDTLEYTLGGTDASSFSIDSETGQLRTSDPLDYEVKNIYSVLVSVSDGKKGEDEISVTINVTDDNEAPIFTEGTSTTRSVVENTAANVAIGDPVSATDQNADTLVYGLSGTDANSFSIDSSSGQIKTSSPLNYEVKTSYSVSALVTDNNGGTDEIAVTINVTDANDAPVFTDGTTSRSVAENLSSGAVVGTPILATDEDDDTLEYSLGGTDASSFNINSSSGQVTTKTLLNHETKDTYSVTVSVTDNNGGTDNISVTINVTDANDAPMFTEGTNTTRSIAENLSSGTAVGLEVVATDEDDDTLEYSLGGTDASSFNIDSSTGQITSGEGFNYEDKDTYSVSVSVTDDNGGTDEIAVSISITDANDKPTFGGFFLSRSIDENSAIGSNVGTPLVATDEDEDTLTYGLSGSDADSFTIDSRTGQLTTSEIFNYEDDDSYSVTLSVSDGRGGTNGAFLTVEVNDVNEAPVFTEGTSTVRAIIESASSGTRVGHAVSAKDEDEDDTLTYSLSGSDASSFGFSTTTGQLSTSGTLDYDVQSSYSVTVTVTDESGLTDVITVEIEVLEFYVEKEEFFDVYYAIKIDSGHLELQTFTIRGYGFDGTTPIYVDNYYKFSDGSSEQTSTGWGSTSVVNSTASFFETWKSQFSEEAEFTHASTRESLKDQTADAARKSIYQTICNAVSDAGTWTSNGRGITYPELDNNDSDDILDVNTILSYLEDDDCDPTN